MSFTNFQFIKNKFNESINNVKSKIENYKSQLNYLNKNAELYNLYHNNNNETLKTISDNSTDILTNERNSFYENESYLSNTIYSSILKYVYILILIMFVVILYVVKKALSIFTVIFLVILFIIIPFLLYMILKLLHSFIKY
jgi:sensor domain CHASE-containing protein